MDMATSEPSMEEILSSIKRIIAEGPESGTVAKTRRRAAPKAESPVEEATAAEDAPVLELTDPLPEEPVEAPAAQPARAPRLASVPQPEEAAVSAESILSDRSTQAARDSLHQLSALLVRPQEGESNTLEGLVREMLRPMLKEWLDARLPEMVETMVKKEIDRIVGRLG